MINFGRGVILAPVCRKDMETLRGWRNCSEVWKWCRQNDVISDVDQERWFERQSADPSIKMYLIKSDQISVGVCGLTSIDLWNHRAEFSLYIDPKQMRKSYGKKGLYTLLDHSFHNLGLNVVWGETFDGNPAGHLFVQTGFAREGVRRQFYFRSGQYIDAHLYSITAKEWSTCNSTQDTSSE